uniref:prolactin-like n=1 Tax=Doryrhamphus excisus TaxID=161450 RepID=UPI0025AE5B1D|nr:prolactin-like [Doryrhamphus excisus]
MSHLRSGQSQPAGREQGSMMRGYFAVVTLLQLFPKVDAVPICSYGHAGCHIPTLADLFERIIQQSSRMHDISTDLHSQYEQSLVPNRNHMGTWKCHTHDILAPDNKEMVQSLGRDRLTQVVLRLLGAWGDPLSRLHQSVTRHRDRDSNHYSNKALQMSDAIQELKAGVLKMAEKMKLVGVAGSNTAAHVPPEGAPTLAYKRGAPSSVDPNDLLYCLRRDADKVKNYLRILQCSSLPGLQC